MFVLVLALFAIVVYKLTVNNNDNNTVKKHKTHIVFLGRKLFSKPEITIKRGDTVSFVNTDIVRHQIVNDTNSIQNSKLLFPNDRYKVTLFRDGTYRFYSSLYSSMNACLVTIK